MRNPTKHRSSNFSTAMRHSAEKRRCPKCGRGSALSFVSDDFGFGRYCRWDGCDYTTYRAREDASPASTEEPT